MDKLLKLDYDSGKVPDIKHIKFIVDKLDLNVLGVQVHRTKKGYHVRISIRNPELCEPEIVLIQSLMGSDQKRECLNYMRVLQCVKHWNVLFKSKENVRGKILSKEIFDSILTDVFNKELVNFKQ